ncbi:MAG TPA: phospholipase, partial [Actinomycetota bacterium]|nr:phospholipase [Actinomycetota bacterium]
PGFLAPGEVTGSPEVFISHGVNDEVLPISRTSRRIVPSLQRRYDLQYEEFDGPHVVPADMVQMAVRRFLS